MADLTTVILSTIGGVVSGGGGVAIIKAVAARRTTKVDAADRLSDGALKWVNEFQDQAREAQAEAKEARAEAKQAHAEAAAARQEAAQAHAEVTETLTQMRTIRAEAQWLATQLADLRRAILDPTITLDRLRAMVGPGDGTDGTPPGR